MLAWKRGRERRRTASIISSGRFTLVSTSFLPLRGEQINDLKEKHRECSAPIYHCFEISNSCNVKSLMMSLNRAEGHSLNELLSVWQLCGSVGKCLPCGCNFLSGGPGGYWKLGACTSDWGGVRMVTGFHGEIGVVPSREGLPLTAHCLVSLEKLPIKLTYWF